jgi:hypothetical protein
LPGIFLVFAVWQTHALTLNGGWVPQNDHQDASQAASGNYCELDCASITVLTSRMQVTESFVSGQKKPAVSLGCIPLNTKVQLHGVVLVHRGYRTWTSLKPDHPICVDSGSQLREIQLFDASRGAVFSALENTAVKVSGTIVSGGGSGYYQTFFAFDVQSVHTPRGNDIVPKEPRVLAIASDLQSYRAQFVATLKPNQIHVAAWTDSGQRLNPANSYVPYILNARGDLAWIGCGEGFTIVDTTLKAEKEEATEINDSVAVGLGAEPLSLEVTCRRK